MRTRRSSKVQRRHRRSHAKRKRSRSPRRRRTYRGLDHATYKSWVFEVTDNVPSTHLFHIDRKNESSYIFKDDSLPPDFELFLDANNARITEDKHLRTSVATITERHMHNFCTFWKSVRISKQIPKYPTYRCNPLFATDAVVDAGKVLLSEPVYVRVSKITHTGVEDLEIASENDTHLERQLSSKNDGIRRSQIKVLFPKENQSHLLTDSEYNRLSEEVNADGIVRVIVDYKPSRGMAIKRDSINGNRFEISQEAFNALKTSKEWNVSVWKEYMNALKAGGKNADKYAKQYNFAYIETPSTNKTFRLNFTHVYKVHTYKMVTKTYVTPPV